MKSYLDLAYILPSRRHLRDYENYVCPCQGFNQEVVNEILVTIKNVGKFSQKDKISCPFISRNENLVWDKPTGDVTEYVDLGNAELNAVALTKKHEFASYALIFLVRSIVNLMKFT